MSETCFETHLEAVRFVWAKDAEFRSRLIVELSDGDEVDRGLAGLLRLIEELRALGSPVQDESVTWTRVPAFVAEWCAVERGCESGHVALNAERTDV